MLRKTQAIWIAFGIAALAAGCSSSHDKDASSSGKPSSGTNGGGSGDRDGAAGSASAGKDDSGGSAGSGGGGHANVPNANLPTFPGAGTSDAGKPLANGMLCDAVAGPDIPIPEQKADCFYDKNKPGDMQVAATLEQVLECAEESQTNLVHLRLTFHPWFVDNTYGASSIGWPHVRGHRFNDLVKSDHAELILTDRSGTTVMQFKLDYFSQDPSRPSGWGSLGVNGGDGAMITGDAADVVKWQTSLALDFNERGYDQYTVDSPKTNEDFDPDPAAPDWDFRVVYEAWVDLAAFGSAGFGGAHIEYVHASPSKSGSDTIEVEPRDCPPPRCGENEADATCSDGGVPPPPDGCADNDPDTFCADGGVPPPNDGCADTDPDTPCTDGGTVGPPPDTGGGTPEMCLQNPDDPACHVE